MTINTFSLLGSINSIDFEKVNPESDPLITKGKIAVYQQLGPDVRVPRAFRLELNEYSAELHDDRVNLLGLNEPKIVKYLNFDPIIRELPRTISQIQSGTSFAINLSSNVTKQKRVVYDIFMMFGDVGGLYDFVFLILSSALGYWSESFMRSSLV